MGEVYEKPNFSHLGYHLITQNGYQEFSFRAKSTLSWVRVFLADNLGMITFYLDDFVVSEEEVFPEMLSSADYYAGGAPMPGRNYNSTDYRYGYGAHEKMDEVSGNGNTVDMGDRWLDTRLVRTFKLDAKASKYPGISPYSYAANNPLIFIDPDGRDIILYNEKGEKAGVYKPGMEPTSSSKLVNETINALNTIHKVENAGNGGPSPKEVVEFLANNHDIKVDITRVKLDGKSYTQDADRLEDTKFSYDGFDRDKSAVSWNPGIGAELLDKEGKPTGEKQSPATVLAHELKHAYNHHTMSKEEKSKLIGTKDPDYVNASEKDATITTETDVAKANKEGVRTFRRHSAKGFFTKDRSSTTTEKATAKPIKP